MENIFKNENNFTAYATISAGYWMLSQINSKLTERKAIDIMIDKATGYSIEQTKEIKTILADIISAKEVLNECSLRDREVLNQVEQIIKNK